MKFVYRSGSRPLKGYTIRRGIGIGGFGEVYFATSDAGKEVALKRVQRNHEVEIRGVGHCLNLKHPNLIDLFDIRYDDEGEAWVVMEYVAGESLKDVIDRNPNGLPEEEMHFWFQGIAAGVSYLHEHGIVHRDLKPGNVFLDDRTVKIGDYGLSKFISCSRRSGQTESVGTFHYMAPEIGKGVYGKEIDVYALGVMLYEMLTGRLPFEGESSQEIIMKHLTASPDLSRVPPAYRETIRRALQKDPDQRFRSVEAMLRSFPPSAAGVTFVSSEPAGGPRVPAPGVAPQPPVRQPAVAEEPRQPEVLFLGPADVAEPPAAGPQPVDQGIAFGPLQVHGDAVPTAPGNPVRTTLLSNEPVAEMVRGGWRSARQGWANSRLSTPAQAFVLIVVVILLVVNMSWLLPLGIVLGAVYLMYIGVRGLIFAFTGEDLARRGAVASRPLPLRSPARAPLHPARRPPSPRPQPPRKATADELRRLAQANYLRQPASQRLSQFTGSMLAAFPIALATVICVLAFSGAPLDASVAAWSQAAWIGLCSAVGAWTLLALGRLWSFDEEDLMLRRTTLLAVGASLGALLWALGGYLHAAPEELVRVADAPGFIAPASWYVNDLPKAPACMAYFALTFALGGWWRLTDPLRTHRVSLIRTAVLVGLAWLAHFLVYFPQPWGMLLVGSLAFATQLAAPFTPRSERRRLAALEGMVV